MTQTIEVSREKLMRDFNMVIAETEQLLNAAAGTKPVDWQKSVELKLKAAKDKLVELEHAAIEKSKAAAQATDMYVHEKPWQSIGVAAGVGAAVGVTVGLLLNRR